MSQDLPQTPPALVTRILKISGPIPGHFSSGSSLERLNEWQITSNTTSSPSSNVSALRRAATHLQHTDIPVAFPTETVYGLGADATRSAAVRGIYAAKGRPSDNPLICHVADLDMLRTLLRGEPSLPTQTNGSSQDPDPIPPIYRPLLNRFWPGPLTVLLPNAASSILAPEVTAGLKNFGARMPRSTLALTLIKLTGRPLAAPSANASTRPSPTTAHDVLEDMVGRIELVLDGGPCEVGIESTVVDGMCDPPVILRPGGISLEEIRRCPGWEKVEKAYKDQSEMSNSKAPRAPGMKYKHYSPRARVILYETSYVAGSEGIVTADAEAWCEEQATIGIVRTKRWALGAGLEYRKLESRASSSDGDEDEDAEVELGLDVHEAQLYSGEMECGRLHDLNLGDSAKDIAQGLFAALRELDRRKADVVFVEGIGDHGDVAAAVMNRLRKAASEIRS